jgi:hypothetical protein
MSIGLEFSRQLSRLLTRAVGIAGSAFLSGAGLLRKHAVSTVSAILLGVIGNFAYDTIKPKEPKSEAKAQTVSEASNPLSPPASRSVPESIAEQAVASEAPLQASSAPIAARVSQTADAAGQPLVGHERPGGRQASKQSTQAPNFRVVSPMTPPTPEQSEVAIPVIPVPLIRPELPGRATPKASRTDQIEDWLAGPLFSSSTQFISQLTIWISKEGEQLTVHFNDNLDLRCRVQFDSAGDPQTLSGCRNFYPTTFTITEDTSDISCEYFKAKIVCTGSIRLSNGVMNRPHSLTIARPLAK